jgi:hypothetical protein
MCSVICKVVYQVFDEMSLRKQIPNGEEFGNGPFIKNIYFTIYNESKTILG